MSISPRQSLGISTTAIFACAIVWTHHGYADSPPGRFDVVNGTVLDKKTKLTWQQTSPSMSYTWADAKTYCNGLNLDGNGWRLPSMKELQTIVDEKKASPAIDSNKFNGNLSDAFWTSSPWAGSGSYAWIVSFYSGYASYIVVTHTDRVRCVR